MITVTVNGKPRQLEAEMRLPDLIKWLEINFPRIAVAHNGEVLRKEEHEATIIRDGDTVEIVRMVGGGSASLNTERLTWHPPDTQ
jgi:thiamine biosynthesis protein ThiS